MEKKISRTFLFHASIKYDFIHFFIFSLQNTCFLKYPNFFTKKILEEDRLLPSHQEFSTQQKKIFKREKKKTKC